MFRSKERENHKYVARVPIGSNKGKTIYRYFYSKEEYQAYLKKKSQAKVQTVADKVSDAASAVKTKAVQAGKSAEALAKLGKAFVEYLVNDPLDTRSFISTKQTVSEPYGSKKVFDARESKRLTARAYLEKRGKEYIDSLKELLNIKTEKTTYTLDKDTEKALRKYKYVQKVTLPNGKIRYFYTQEEYDRYMQRLEYQETAPSFMKDIPRIDENYVLSKNEDMAVTNPNYSPYNVETSTNCFYCTTAYELRARGYDVEAAINPGDDTYRGQLWYPEKMYSNANILKIEPSGEVFDINPLTDACAEKDSWKITYGDLKNVDDPKAFVERYNQEFTYTGEDLRTAIANNNPKGSRGNLMVTWKQGSAHSMVYEVDSHGNVIIRDAQTNDIYTADFIAENSAQMYFVRTDNLGLKADILNTVTYKKKERNEDDNRASA